MTIKELCTKVREAAEAATPGPWFYRPEPYDDWGFIRTASPDSLPGELVAVVKKHQYVGDDALSQHRKDKTDPDEADGNYIATVNPSVALALLGRIEELEKLVGNSVHALDYAMSEMVSDAPLRRKVEATRSACAKALSGDTP